MIKQYGGEFKGAKDFPIKKADSVLNESGHDHGHGKDPYDELGAGFQAYFTMLRSFTCLFLVFTVIMVPVFMIYESQHGLDGTYNYQNAKYSLGNMGFSSSQCVTQYTNLN